jgi:hypothetical protein
MLVSIPCVCRYFPPGPYDSGSGLATSMVVSFLLKTVVPAGGPQPGRDLSIHIRPNNRLRL